MQSLVIYFSKAGQNYVNGEIKSLEVGNTEVVALKIAQLTNAQVFKVETIKDYPDDYRECCKVAQIEKSNDIHPDLKNYLNDISNYGIIYIGYPIWYGSFPMPLVSLLERLDFNDKIIKPFVTHEGSKQANSINDLNELCKGATIMDALVIKGSDVLNTNDIISNWINVSGENE